MPALIDAMVPAMDEGERTRAKDFWNNAYAYAMQSVPYAQERLDALNQAGNEVVQQLVMLPEDQQEKLFNQLKDDLIKPIEGDTAKEYDAAWKKLQGITQALHKRLVPTMPQMMNAGMAQPSQPSMQPGAPLGRLTPPGVPMPPDQGAY